MLMHEWAYLRGKKLLVEPVGLCRRRFDQTAKHNFRSSTVKLADKPQPYLIYNGLIREWIYYRIKKRSEKVVLYASRFIRGWVYLPNFTVYHSLCNIQQTIVKDLIILA